MRPGHHHGGWWECWVRPWGPTSERSVDTIRVRRDLFPGEMRSPYASSTDPRWPHSCPLITIDFVLPHKVRNARVHYVRGGGEREDLSLDGVWFDNIGGPSDPYRFVDYVNDLGTLSAGAHDITIEPVGPATGEGYHWVDGRSDPGIRDA